MALTSGFGPSIAVTTSGGSSVWDVQNLFPGTPGLDAERITSVATLEATYKGNFGSVNSNIVPGGNHYQIQGDGSKDLVLDLTGESTVLTIPIQIRDWQDVYIRGVEMDLAIPSGGDVGEIFDSRPNTPNQFNANPVLQNGGIAIMVSARGTVFAEGCLIDANGIECDYFVSRGIDGPYVPFGSTTREFHIQNCRLTNAMGSTHFIHQDLFQQQGVDQGGSGGDMTFLRWIRLENVYMHGGQHGLSVHQKGSHKLDLEIRNFTGILTNEDNPNVGAEQIIGGYLVGAHDSMSQAASLENCHYWQTAGFSTFLQWIQPPGQFGDPSTFEVAANAPNTTFGGAVINPNLTWLTNGVSNTATAQAAAALVTHGATDANTGYSYVSPHGAI
jgi:hypothetical protein